MKKLLFLISAVLFLGACEQIDFACDEISANAAADFINEKYEQYGGALELHDAQLIKAEPNHLYCRARANVNTKYINYELVRKSNGDIYVMVNPLGDAINEAIEEIEDIDFFDFD